MRGRAKGGEVNTSNKRLTQENNIVGTYAIGLNVKPVQNIESSV